MPRDGRRQPKNLRHDLLATVHTLMGAVELLLTTRLTTRQRRYVNVCKRSVESLIALSSQVSSGSSAGRSFNRPAIDDLAELGVSYVPKPVTRGPLVEKIRSLGGQHRPRVLVAEDSPDSCMLIRQYLHDSARVDIVHDGRSAVEKYQTVKYDVLVIDLEMPIMDGCAAIREIRSWETEQNRPHVPVVVLTAHDLISPIAKDGPARGTDGAGVEVEEEIVIVSDPEIAHLVPGFLAGRRHDVQTLLQALTDSNYDVIRTVGHMLKGAGGGYGFNGISVVGHRLEEGAEQQDFQKIREAVGELSDYLERVKVISPAVDPAIDPAVDPQEPAHVHQY